VAIGASRSRRAARTVAFEKTQGEIEAAICNRVSRFK